MERDRRGLEASQAHYEDLQAGSRAAEIKAAEEEVADRRAALDLAKPELERQQILLSKKVGTPRDVDVARTNVERAAANLKMSEERLRLAREGFRRHQTEQARADVSRARTVLKQSEVVASESEIRAPADGVILHRMAEPGLLLGPGSRPSRWRSRTASTCARTSRRRSSDACGLGSAAEVSVDAFPGKTFPARVTEISPDAEFTPKPVDTPRERVNLVYAAKVDLDAGWNAPLVPGQPADVRVRAPETRGEVIRAAKLVRNVRDRPGAPKGIDLAIAQGRAVRPHRTRRRRQDDVLPDRRGPPRSRPSGTRRSRDDVPFGLVPAALLPLRGPHRRREPRAEGPALRRPGARGGRAREGPPRPRRPRPVRRAASRERSRAA